jgi:hypothetical protein
MKKKLTEPRPLDALQKLFGNDLVSVYVCPIKESDATGIVAKRGHD